MFSYYLYRSFQSELWASCQYYKVTLIYTKYVITYQVYNAKLDNEVITFIGDFKIEPLCKSTCIDIILQDKIVGGFTCLYRKEFTRKTVIKLADSKLESKIN